MDPDLSDLLSGLNPRQREAVAAPDGPVLVVAGPGSGKTRVLTHRIAALLRHDVPAWRILAVTFTNKAAEEMRNRLTALVGEEASSELWVSTFHRLCGRLLRNSYAEAGLPRTFAIADDDDSKAIMKKVLTSMGLEAKGEDLSRPRSRISLAKNRLETMDQLAQSHSLADRHVATIWAEYEKRLREAGLIDFDDMLVLTLKVLREHPKVAEKYAKRFLYVLVDEYQDTNLPQYEIIKILAGEHRNLMAVGDLQQSIYGWRGAAPELLAQFTSDWPGSKIVTLDQNYRSSPEILEVVRAIIDPIARLHKVELWTDRSGGVPVRLHACQDADSEAQWIADQIRRSIDRGASPSDHAVLIRTNAQSRVLEAALQAKRMRVELIGTTRFYDRAEVKDVLAYLRLLTNNADPVALARAAGVPRRGLGAVALDSTTEAARAAGLPVLNWVRAALCDPEQPLGRSQGAWEKFCADLDVIDAAARADGPAAAVTAILELPGFKEAILAKGGEAPQDRLDNLQELVSAATAFMESPPADFDIDVRMAEFGTDSVGFGFLLGYMEHVSLVSSTDVSEGAGAVKLLSCHASKGREFPHVYVAGVEDGFFPHVRSGDDTDEERRLLFVAVSRAEQSLTLTYASRRRPGSVWVDRDPSPFLGDLPPTVVQSEEEEPLYKTPQSSWSKQSGPAWPSRGSNQRRTPATAPRPASKMTTPFRMLPATNRPQPRTEVPPFAVGDKVLHKVFGQGTITELNGWDATVHFSSKVKQLDLRFAPLEKVA